MSKFGWLEYLALFVCLPLLIVLCYTNWRLLQNVKVLDHAVLEYRQTEIRLWARVRDSLGREELSLKALQELTQQRDKAFTQVEMMRQQAEQAFDEAKRQSEIAERLRQQRSKELDLMKDALGRIAETDRTPLGVLVQLGEDAFLFDFDKSDLGPENREILSRIAGVLLASYGYSLYVYGHTDDQGNAEYNMGLSERRAQSVKDYLVRVGIPEEIIESKGFGLTSPRLKGTSNEVRRKNRRVEIGVVDTVVEYQQEVVATN